MPRNASPYAVLRRQATQELVLAAALPLDRLANRWMGGDRTPNGDDKSLHILLHIWRECKLIRDPAEPVLCRLGIDKLLWRSFGHNSERQDPQEHDRHPRLCTNDPRDPHPVLAFHSTRLCLAQVSGQLTRSFPSFRTGAPVYLENTQGDSSVYKNYKQLNI